MKTLCLLEEKLRNPLALSRLSQFRYIEVNKKESVQNINREHEFLLCFVLKGSLTNNLPFFASAEGEFDFSRIDFTRIYKSSTKRTVLANGMDYVEPVAYTEQLELYRLYIVWLWMLFL